MGNVTGMQTPIGHLLQLAMLVARTGDVMFAPHGRHVARPPRLQTRTEDHIIPKVIAGDREYKHDTCKFKEEQRICMPKRLVQQFKVLGKTCALLLLTLSKSVPFATDKEPRLFWDIQGPHHDQTARRVGAALTVPAMSCVIYKEAPR